MRISSSSARTRAAPARNIAWLSARMSRFIDFFSLLPRDLLPEQSPHRQVATTEKSCLQFGQCNRTNLNRSQSLSNQYHMFSEPLSPPAQSNHRSRVLKDICEV